MEHVQTDFGRIAFLDRGAGPAVVLLHANGHDHRDFDPVIDELAKEFRVLALDWPGHGDSTWNRAPRDMTGQVLADALNSTVHQLDVGRAVFVGCSMGGYAACRLAIDHPEMVGGLVLVNSGGFLPRNPFTWMFCRTLGTERINRRIMPRFIDSYMKAVSPHDARIAANAKARMATGDGVRLNSAIWRSFNARSYDLRRQAEKIQVPTSLIWGALDPTLGAKAAKATNRALPAAELTLLEAGHTPFSSLPDEFLQAALPFIRRCHRGEEIPRALTPE